MGAGWIDDTRQTPRRAQRRAESQKGGTPGRGVGRGSHVASGSAVGRPDLGRTQPEVGDLLAEVVDHGADAGHGRVRWMIRLRLGAAGERDQEQEQGSNPSHARIIAPGPFGVTALSPIRPKHATATRRTAI